MDFLNKSFAQLTDLLQGMTPGARITTGLLLVVVVVSVGYLFAHATSGPDVYLLDGADFSYGEMNAIRAALETAMDHEQHELETRRREFLDWWSPQRRANLCRGFERYVDPEAPGQSPAALPAAPACQRGASAAGPGAVCRASAACLLASL